MSEDSPEEHVVLLVEDNRGDVRLAQEALKDRAYSLQAVADGVEAMAYLKREGSYESAPRVQLVLLDLNVPRKDGREVLAEIKNDPDLRRIPVVILSSSEADSDINSVYDLGANAYVTKPIGFDKHMNTIRNICDFWLNIARSPSA
jgi:CheY-like chemotaxis protein